MTDTSWRPAILLQVIEGRCTKLMIENIHMSSQGVYDEIREVLLMFQGVWVIFITILLKAPTGCHFTVTSKQIKIEGSPNTFPEVWYNDQCFALINANSPTHNIVHRAFKWTPTSNQQLLHGCWQFIQHVAWFWYILLI